MKGEENRINRGTEAPQAKTVRKWEVERHMGKKSNSLCSYQSKTGSARLTTSLIQFWWFCVSTDFLRASHLLTGAQRAVEGAADCPSDAVWLTSWCVLQSTLPCVLPCPALRTAARSTLPPPTSAPQAGTDPLRYQSCARRRTDSILEHRRRAWPASQAPGLGWRTAPSPLKARRSKHPACRPLLWQTHLRNGEKGLCPQIESWSPLHLTPDWCERPRWRSTPTTPSGCCRGSSCQRN